MLTANRGEITFSKRLGFLEAGKDLDNMMRHTARAMDWIGIVRYPLDPSPFIHSSLSIS
jgi:hypothetical protein